MKRMILPPIGEYTNIARREVERMGLPLEIIVSRITKETTARGCQLSESEMCLPYKITLGSILDAVDRHEPDYVGFFDTCGTCRFKLYSILCEKVFQRRGLSQQFKTFNFVQPIRSIMSAFGTGPLHAFYLLKSVAQQIQAYDRSRFAAWDGEAPRIGVVGEIYTVLEPRANLNTLKILKDCGAWVHNSLTLSAFVTEKLPWALRKLLGLERQDIDERLWKQCEKDSYHWFPRHEIGGHGRRSVTASIYFARMGYDMILHLYPFPCMPEVSIAQFVADVGRHYGIPVMPLMFDADFGEANLRTRLEAAVSMLKMKRHGSLANAVSPCTGDGSGLWLGIDVGSVSTKAVLLTPDYKVADEVYVETASDPVTALGHCLDRLKTNVVVRGVGVTGSGRNLAAVIVGADSVADEITCQALGSFLAEPKVRTILEIGGQDSKYLELDERGLLSYFNMNNICSAGTGSFFSGTSKRLGIPIEEFGPIATDCQEHVKVTGRCAVFAESDLISKQQAGVSKPALIKGLCQSLPHNYLMNVAKGRRIVGPVVFTGGVASNVGVRQAFERILGQYVTVPQHNKLTGAMGAAIMASKADPALSTFKGFAALEASVERSYRECPDCPNNCELSIIEHRETQAVFGSKCGKF